MFIERADRVWTATIGGHTIGLIAGEEGTVLIDLPARDAADVLAEASRVAGSEVTEVVLTHPQDLTALADLGTVRVRAHESYGDQVGSAAPSAEISTLVAIAAIDLGDRRVEVIHPGRAHTDADLVAVVPDSPVLFVGDLIGDPLRYGADSWPLEWANTLDQVIALMNESSQVVTGHDGHRSEGGPDDRDLAITARSTAAAVSHEITELIGRGVPFERAGAEGNWAIPFDLIADAVAAEWRRSGTSGPSQGRPLLPLV